MEGLDGGERLASFLRVWNGLGFFESFFTRADCLGKPVLIEFGRLWLPPARRDVFRCDGDGLEAGFRDREGGGRRAQGLETDLLQSVGEEPAFELDPVFCAAFAGLEFVQGGFGAVDEDFVVND
jgi:hypothetical protein